MYTFVCAFLLLSLTEEDVMNVPTQQAHRKQKTSDYEVFTIRTTNHDDLKKKV